MFFPEPGQPIDLTLEVVFAGYGITAPEFGYDDYAGLDVTGKAVLVFDHEPQENDPKSVFHGTGFTLHANLWTKTRNAERHGAAAVLVVTEPVNSHRSAARAPDRANAPPQALARSELRIPRFVVSPDVAAALLQSTGRTPAEWQTRIDRAPISLVAARWKACRYDFAPRTRRRLHRRRGTWPACCREPIRRCETRRSW